VNQRRRMWIMAGPNRKMVARVHSTDSHKLSASSPNLKCAAAQRDNEYDGFFTGNPPHSIPPYSSEGNVRRRRSSRGPGLHMIGVPGIAFRAFVGVFLWNVSFAGTQSTRRPEPLAQVTRSSDDAPGIKHPAHTKSAVPFSECGKCWLLLPEREELSLDANPAAGRRVAADPPRSGGRGDPRDDCKGT